MASHMESGLEVREDASRLPESYMPGPQKDSSAAGGHYYNGPLLGGHPYDQHMGSNQHIKTPEKEDVRPLAPRICGLSPLLFGLTTALTAALIVGAAVGGGLGSALAHAKTPPTPTTTSPPTVSTTPTGLLTNYTVAPGPSISSLPLPCPAVDGNTYTSLNGQTWAVSCAVEQANGDIGSLLAYTYTDCVEACAAMNRWQRVERACESVQFSARVATIVEHGGFGNCYLKNGSAVAVKPSEGAGLSAKLTG
ncbi:hypothetical protein PRZ48_007563 [Zasmidium cellare]|uniref:Apple domain-containing protein n=1 Tax=Zasmidium cellare TaxID=395010 RepID=A0ABR0EJN3_ZASCE|nr:hypothetical protein PRZ48_007563 [Zasmidium cellare]